MALYDFRGQPVNTAALKAEAARPAKSGARAWAFTSVARGITPEKLAGVFAKADRGDIADLVTLGAEIEERDAHAGAQLQTRKLAIAALPWKVEAASDDARDVEIAEAFQAQVVGSGFWVPAVVNALDGLCKPFAALEIMWEPGPTWSVVDLKWRDQRHFKVSEEDGESLALKVEGSAVGQPLAPWKWIIHSPVRVSGPMVKRGLVRPLAVVYAIKTMAAGAWLSFVELYGIPMRIGKYPVGASADELASLEDAIRSIGSDAAGIMPSTMALELHDAIGKGNTGEAHAKLVKWAEEQQSKAILGQTMTADNGASLAQAKVHNEVRRDILKADATALADTFTRDLLRPWVDINYGPPPKGYPRLVCVTDEPEDTASFTSTVLPWVQQGLTVESSVIRDRLGLPEPAEGAEVLGEATAPALQGASRADRRGKRQASGRRFAAEEDDGEDFIDRDGQPDDFEETMGPLRNAVLKAARGASDFAGFLADLERATVDGDALAKSLALKTTIARGVGDATDDTEI